MDIKCSKVGRTCPEEDVFGSRRLSARSNAAADTVRSNRSTIRSRRLIKLSNSDVTPGFWFGSQSGDGRKMDGERC